MYGDILSSILTECVSGVAADQHGCIKIYKDNYLQTTLKAFRQQFEIFSERTTTRTKNKGTNKQQQQQNYQPFVRGVARCGLQSTLKCSSTSASFLSSLASWKAARKGSSLESEMYASLARPRYAFNRKLATRSWSNFIRFRHSIQLQSNLSGCKKRLIEI